MIGKRVRLKEDSGFDWPMPPDLIGQTGTVMATGRNGLWHVQLDNRVPGFGAGRVWCDTKELEEI